MYFTQLTAVDPDADQLSELQTTVAQLLPNVSANFCQETAQSWNGGDQPFDVVLLFHCLYYVRKLERPAFFKKLFDNVVAEGGFVFVITAPYDLQNPSVFGRLKYSFMKDEKIAIPVDGLEVDERLKLAGFCEWHQMSFEFQVNVEEPHDDLMALFMFWNGGRLRYEQVRRTIKESIGSQKYLPTESYFGVFIKPSLQE